MQEPFSRKSHPWVTEGLCTVKAGVSFIDPCADWKKYCACAQVVEELDFDALWVTDHPLIATDCWSILTALALATHKIRLGSLVNCVYYRNPVLLARQAADVDRFSEGRLILGLGIGDQPLEFARLELPFPSIPERQKMLAHVIRSVRENWEHLAPGPVQQPYIPLLVAGGGKRTLYQVAQYADASNFGPHRDTGGVAQYEDVVRKCQELSAHCLALGREEHGILRTHITLPLVLAETAEALSARQEVVQPALRERLRSGTVSATVPEAVEYYTHLLQSGIHYFIIGIWPGDLETLHLFAKQVLPKLRNL